MHGTHSNSPDLILTETETYRVLTDHLGSPRLVIDLADGTVVQRVDYAADGRILTDTAPLTQPFGFAGGRKDEGLLYFGARDYWPELGRFTSRDPLGFAGGSLNLYEYSQGDPINRLDPVGLNVETVNCGYFQRFVEHGAHTWDAIQGGYYPLGLGESPTVNANYPSAVGPVDIDWMLNTAYAGSVTAFPGLVLRAVGDTVGSDAISTVGRVVATAGGMLGASLSYWVFKPFRNAMGGSNPFLNILDPAQLRSYIAAGLWLGGMPASELFAPSIDRCKQCGHWK